MPIQGNGKARIVAYPQRGSSAGELLPTLWYSYYLLGAESRIRRPRRRNRGFQPDLNRQYTRNTARKLKHSVVSGTRKNQPKYPIPPNTTDIPISTASVSPALSPMFCKVWWICRLSPMNGLPPRAIRRRMMYTVSMIGTPKIHTVDIG